MVGLSATQSLGGGLPWGACPVTSGSKVSLARLLLSVARYSFPSFTSQMLPRTAWICVLDKEVAKSYFLASASGCPNGVEDMQETFWSVLMVDTDARLGGQL